VNDTVFSIRPEDTLHTKNADRHKAINRNDDTADNNINYLYKTVTQDDDCVPRRVSSTAAEN
jgi:hypothetical protein